MLKRESRITKKEDFEAVYRQGRNFSSGMITALVRNNGLNITRFGIVVSTKFSKYAVERNRAKRQTRAIIKKYEDSIRPGIDVVIIMRKTGAKTSYKSSELEEGLKEIFQKAKLISQKKK